jgi:hypothetical protein
MAVRRCLYGIESVGKSGLALPGNMRVNSE